MSQDIAQLNFQVVHVWLQTGLCIRGTADFELLFLIRVAEVAFIYHYFKKLLTCGGAGALFGENYLFYCVDFLLAKLQRTVRWDNMGFLVLRKEGNSEAALLKLGFFTLLRSSIV